MGGTYRGLYLLGNKRAQTVRAVEIVDPAGKTYYGPVVGIYFAGDPA
jgi:hypothetical protein